MIYIVEDPEDSEQPSGIYYVNEQTNTLKVIWGKNVKDNIIDSNKHKVTHTVSSKNLDDIEKTYPELLI